MMLVKPPNTLREFMHRPSEERWRAELEAGWPGPDGSSSSFDLIMGVRIGVSSPGYEHADLPANRHDWYYRLGRRFRLPAHYRRAADLAYRDMCKRELRKRLEGPMLWIGLARCHVRYAALRLGARFAWTAKAKQRSAEWTGE